MLFLLETSIRRLPLSPFSNNSAPKSDAEICRPGIISDKTKFIILIMLWISSTIGIGKVIGSSNGSVIVPILLISSCFTLISNGKKLRLCKPL